MERRERETRSFILQPTDMVLKLLLSNLKKRKKKSIFQGSMPPNPPGELSFQISVILKTLHKALVDGICVVLPEHRWSLASFTVFGARCEGSTAQVAPIMSSILNASGYRSPQQSTSSLHVLISSIVPAMFDTASVHLLPPSNTFVVCVYSFLKMFCSKQLYLCQDRDPPTKLYSHFPLSKHQLC